MESNLTAENNRQSITLPIESEVRCDVLVAGGGVSGCCAALAAARRELRSRKYFWMTIGIQLGTAYAVSLLVYQIGRLFVH